MNLTDNEIRIKVAEACGWSNVKVYPRSEVNKRHSDDEEPIAIGRRHPSWGAGSCSVPNYPLDLNSCAQFEAELSVNEWSPYLDALGNICVPVHICPTTHSMAVVCATARQRCLAYLKTKGILL